MMTLLKELFETYDNEVLQVNTDMHAGAVADEFVEACEQLGLRVEQEDTQDDSFSFSVEGYDVSFDWKDVKECVRQFCDAIRECGFKVEEDDDHRVFITPRRRA
jgi:hypothetical protein